ncbi:hypothetical protein PENTCL1PPCAC_27013 [Pristionchus entomophagus]|uniref:Uncharacterized protein n=1 Tax=Pristionchus entomophagus TaxID=358040 RepID=A0AAV5UFW2_9BILA|nr:hypothetical protein PENTCL1PPCAC_27013 [Pristionchus entomophagus]
MDCPCSIEDDPGTIALVVDLYTAKGLNSVVEILSIDEHMIDNFHFSVGLPSPIEITTSPMDLNTQRMLVRDFQSAFGAVIGFRLVKEKEGECTLRITFMHWEHASGAFRRLSIIKGQPFLRGMDKYILSDVVHLKTWSF